eukprot:TRINITY_DN17548_c0_g1_i1.p1 TRINITY_DN17548_c0_g1~~TRINITY_DN17548_c0_g1_i1.p1  ORF type:complete len:669 (+),score=65.05 TRINITY_DN17548_c0_g1_i1:69-2075(+)
MGIKGLQSFIENQGIKPDYLRIEHLQVQRGLSFIAVDGYALYRKFGAGSDWLQGGEYGSTWHRVVTFVNSFTQHGVDLVVVFDGNPYHDMKLEVWKTRRLRDRAECLGVQKDLSEGRLPDNYKKWRPPFFHMLTIRAALLECRAKVLVSYGEGDLELARIAQHENCLGVLSEGSDFFVLPVRRYFSMNKTEWRGPSVRTLASYRGGVLAELLGLETDELPLWATLNGNDFSRGLPAGRRLTTVSSTDKCKELRVAEEVQLLRSEVSARGALALATHLWPEATDLNGVATYLQKCLDQYSPAAAERDARVWAQDPWAEAHYYGRLPSDLVPLRRQRVKYKSAQFCAPGRADPGMFLQVLEGPYLSMIFADIADVSFIPVFECSLDEESFCSRDCSFATCEGPSLIDVWGLPDRDKDVFFQRMLDVSAPASMCSEWGSLGCALLAGSIALKLGALNAKQLEACLLAMMLVVDHSEGITRIRSQAAVPSVSAVHDCYIWIEALNHVEQLWRVLFDAGRAGQARRSFLQPARCLDGPLTCALLQLVECTIAEGSTSLPYIDGFANDLAGCARFVNMISASGGDSIEDVETTVTRELTSHLEQLAVKFASAVPINVEKFRVGPQASCKGSKDGKGSGTRLTGTSETKGKVGREGATGKGRPNDGKGKGRKGYR